MKRCESVDQVGQCLERLAGLQFAPLDLLPRGDLAEKVVELVLSGTPAGPAAAVAGLDELAATISAVDTNGVRVVVFGGGTGLSNLLGGDSRHPAWPDSPFHGLKELFPCTRAVVCITDDGGSTGELLKDLPLIALGDLRHVMLSSVSCLRLQAKYGLTEDQAFAVAGVLHRLFNCRYDQKPPALVEFIRQEGIDLQLLPDGMRAGLLILLNNIEQDSRLSPVLLRPHCLGNLLLAAAIYRQVDNGLEVSSDSLLAGLGSLSNLVGAGENSVLPCTTTPAILKILYANGVLVTGEYKSGHARRGYPVDRVLVEFADQPSMPAEVAASISQADIILFAPGSLYSSIIPILQVPGIAGAIRANHRALKVLVSNLWIQQGETDLVREEPKRRFYVSDLIKAYNRNIPGGVQGLFRQIMVLGLQEIPGSILQSYALEDKVPIYLDRDKVAAMGFAPLESRIFSGKILEERRVVQHDPLSLARALRAIWAIRSRFDHPEKNDLSVCSVMSKPLLNRAKQTPRQRGQLISKRLAELEIDPELRVEIFDILWRHQDIPVGHLDFLQGVMVVKSQAWQRSQIWDLVFSFYDPFDRLIKVRHDVLADRDRFEVAFLVALGQSLLGNYVGQKEMLPVEFDGEQLGQVFRLNVRPSAERCCLFSDEELDRYLHLVRMNRSAFDPLSYSRLVNGSEGFTPPGMLFGLLYAWYLDNRFAAHIEYKMTILRMERSDLVAEQSKITDRRRDLIDYFREVVFQHSAEIYS
ncbi:MAG: YvcK family protein [Proteobacteria bacterium]|nr:YvcK family protein [Pseudomonadota bacterium]MBU1716781.1 YvcK family protein [Pseudomonadota bacterium]